MRFLQRTSLLLLVGAGALVAQTVTTSDEMYLKIRAIGEQLECQCGCSYTVGSCNMLRCHFREELKPQIQAGIQAGLPAATIIENLIEKYGSALRTAPRAQGFGLMGWAMPFFALLAGLMVVPFVVRRWRAKRVAPSTVRVDESDWGRYQAQIEKDLADFE